MNVIKENVENEIIIKNSRFICSLFFVNDINDVENYLNTTKNKYPRANHYCYSYIIGPNKKTSDDGEPNKTAGLPILNVLGNNKINNCLCIVTRYFGGIKLGASGLVRAYSNSVVECLKKTEILKLIDGYLIKINTSYAKLRELDYILNNYEIINKIFLDKVYYEVKVDKKLINILKKQNFSYEIIDNIYIKIK